MIIREAAMKDRILQIAVLVLLLLFGLRGVLPEIIDHVHATTVLAVMLVAVAGVITYRNIANVLRNPNFRRRFSKRH